MTQSYDQGKFEGTVLQALERIEKALENHGPRIRELELEQTKLKTWASVAGAAGGAVVAFLMKTLPGIKA